MIQIVAEITEELMDPLEEYFCEWSVSPWMIIQKKDNSPVFLHGYFETEGEARDAWMEVSSQFEELPEEPEFSILEDQDWKESYKKHFKPLVFNNLHWVPEWERESYIVPEGDAVIYLDPGMAFGTGDHPTTRLMAHALIEYSEGLSESGRSFVDIIDAGCGSGILALSAYKLGFANVYGFDLDAESVRICEENAAVNGIAGEVDFAEAGIEDGLHGRKADLMLANILANVLTVYSENLITAIKGGGTLGLSGILAKEVEEVQSHFDAEVERLGRQAKSRIEIEGDWASLIYYFGD